MTTPIASEAQKAATSPYVVLFEIDLRPRGGELLRLCASAEHDGPVHFGGAAYTPVPIEAEGFEWTSQGPPVSPTVTIGDVAGEVTGLIEAFGHPLGCKFTRIRTFARYLDSGPEPDAGQRMPLDVYRVERPVEYAPGELVRYELTSWYSNEGKMTPKRQVLRDFCSRTYRRWDGQAFDYSRAQCPYAGAASWNAKGEVCPPEADLCGKRLRDCELRFGDDPLGLPTWAFPGMTRIK